MGVRGWAIPHQDVPRILTEALGTGCDLWAPQRQGVGTSPGLGAPRVSLTLPLSHFPKSWGVHDEQPDRVSSCHLTLADRSPAFHGVSKAFKDSPAICSSLQTG